MSYYLKECGTNHVVFEDGLMSSYDCYNQPRKILQFKSNGNIVKINELLSDSGIKVQFVKESTLMSAWKAMPRDNGVFVHDMIAVPHDEKIEEDIMSKILALNGCKKQEFAVICTSPLPSLAPVEMADENWDLSELQQDSIDKDSISKLTSKFGPGEHYNHYITPVEQKNICERVGDSLISNHKVSDLPLVEDIENTFSQLVEFVEIIRYAVEDLPLELSRVERQLTDLDHLTEFSDLNAVTATKVNKKRQRLLKERRYIKDSYRLCTSLNVEELDIVAKLFTNYKRQKASLEERTYLIRDPDTFD